MRPVMICMDLEGVLIPEVWIAFAEKTGIPELRRTTRDTANEMLTSGTLNLDPTSHRVSIDDNLLELAPMEFQLLQFFMTHPERVYSRQQLIDGVWGTTVLVEERTVDVHIRRLRMALEPSGHDQLIQTVRGAGYRFSSHD